MKPKKYQYYILSIMLIISGLILLFSDIYSKGPVNRNDIVKPQVQNEAEIYPWDNTGPDYIVRTNKEYEFCKSGYCWNFDTTLMEPINMGYPYIMPNKYKQTAKLNSDNSDSNFSLNYLDGDVFVCSNNGCWLIQEGVNNILPYNKFTNPSGKSTLEFLKLKPLVE